MTNTKFSVEIDGLTLAMSTLTRARAACSQSDDGGFVVHADGTREFVSGGQQSAARIATGAATDGVS